MGKCCKVVMRFLFCQREAWQWMKRLVFWLIMLFCIAVALAGIAKTIDIFNVARRTAELSAPFIPLIPWILGFGLAVYIIHVPGVFKKLPELVDRLEEAFGLRFKPQASLSDEDRAYLFEMLSSAVKDAVNKSGTVGESATSSQAPQTDNASSGGALPPLKSELERTMDRQARIRLWEMIVLQRHREKYGGVPFDSRKYSPLLRNQFDDVIRRNDEIIAVEAKAIRPGLSSRASMVSAIMSWNSARNRFREFEHKKLLLEILFCADETFHEVKALTDIVRDCLGVQQDIRVYLYRFNANDTVENVEEIA